MFYMYSLFCNVLGSDFSRVLVDAKLESLREKHSLFIEGKIVLNTFQNE